MRSLMPVSSTGGRVNSDMMDLLSSKLEFDVNGVSAESERLPVRRPERNIRNDYTSFN